MKRYHWLYAHTSSSQHGSMICASCNKPIEDGSYRYRDSRNGFIIHHKVCSLDDPNWKKLQHQEDQIISQTSERLHAYETFRNKWGECLLDEEIESMKQFLGIE